MFWTGVVVGLVIGGFLGVIAISLLQMARREP